MNEIWIKAGRFSFDDLRGRAVLVSLPKSEHPRLAFIEGKQSEESGLMSLKVCVDTREGDRVLFILYRLTQEHYDSLESTKIESSSILKIAVPFNSDHRM